MGELGRGRAGVRLDRTLGAGLQARSSGAVLAEGGLDPGAAVNVKTALGVRRVERRWGLCGCLVPNGSSVSCMGP